MAGHRRIAAAESPPSRLTPAPLSLPGLARLERLQKRLASAEQRYDHLQETLDPGAMRGQQDIAGQRAKVLQLRSEILEIEMGRRALGSESWRELREARDALLRAVKEAEQAARAASTRGAEDDLRELARARKERNEARLRFGVLS